MSEFTIRSESVDVEQIMKQIRQRILEKRGADYTEDQIRELASVRLEKFLDPQEPALRPARAVPQEPAGGQHRAAGDRCRPTPPTGSGHLRHAPRRAALHAQAAHPDPEAVLQPEHAATRSSTRRRSSTSTCSSARRAGGSSSISSRAEWNALYYEVLHNLVLETTRMGIEVQNLRMKVESLSSRLDFSERRVRALEGVVQYRPEVDAAPTANAATATTMTSRRRSRRRPDQSKASCRPAASQGQGQGQGDGTGASAAAAVAVVAVAAGCRVHRVRRVHRCAGARCAGSP